MIDVLPVSSIYPLWRVAQIEKGAFCRQYCDCSRSTGLSWHSRHAADQEALKRHRIGAIMMSDYRLLRCLKIIADPCINPVEGLPRQNAAHESNVSTGFAKLQLHTGTQFIILRDSIRCHERVIQCMQDQSGSFDFFYEGTATGASIVIIDTVKAV